jgi:hypothetical protein
VNFKRNIHNIIKIENELGLYNAVKPDKTIKYDGVFILGGTFKMMIDRINFYQSLISEGFIDSNLKVCVFQDIEISMIKQVSYQMIFSNLIFNFIKKKLHEMKLT